MSSSKRGVFIVIEGTDGSGKGTQFKLLTERLKQGGYEVATFDFPRYSQPSAHFVERYLNGEYGTAEDVGPYTSSLFYALDRYEAAPEIRKALDEGKIVLSNRFSSSSMAHQGTKIDNKGERFGYYTWLEQLEHDMLHIPQPDLNIVLRVPAETAQELVDKKERRSYTEKKRDIHEADLGHMQRAVTVYDELVKLFPKNFVRIDCVENEQLMSIPTISNLIWEKVSPLLPKKAEVPKLSKKKGNPYIKKNPNGSYSITDEGRDYLKEAVTDTDKPVYVFTDKLSNATVAAAMARLSRRGDDMRVTILDEFALDEGKDEGLLKRVITAYGDDSVQQLAGLHLVVEGASNLLTKKLEWGRLAAYLEQSTRYIYFDQKDEKGNYKYFTPKNLDAGTAKRYEDTMNQIFEIYSEMVHKLTNHVREHSSVPKKERDIAWKGATRAQACDAIRAVLPVATKATVGVFGSGQAIESLIMHLMSDPLLEARDSGEAILAEARKVIPVFLERADKPDRGGAVIAYRANTHAGMRALADKHLPQRLAAENEAVQLIDYWPKNEFDLVPHMLYEHSNLPLEEIQKEVAGWPYEEKAAVFKAYTGERLNRRHRPGRAFEQAHYSWDLVCDYGIFRDLQRHRMVDDLEWQELTPRYGYDVPELVETAGLSDLFERCFDLSSQLYSEMQAAGYQLEAQYATLLGHKMRWKVMFNAREAYHWIELRTSPQGHPGYRQLTKQLYDKITEVHPILAEGMSFVNKDEDPELTRLAAEKYTQFKLKKLEKSKNRSSK